MLWYWSRLCSSASCTTFHTYACGYFRACARSEGGGVSGMIDMGTDRPRVVFVWNVCDFSMLGFVLLWYG